MYDHSSRSTERETARPRLEVAEVFARFGRQYRETHHVSPDQHKVMRAIERCRTAALGGHLDQCSTCGLERPAYNSCRNRHCPKCQALAQLAWLEGRKARILPTHHFHVVFTLPGQLRGLARQNPEAVYDLLFRSAAHTLLELGRDPKRLGALLGLTAVLHTWTRELAFHPHIHCIVTGGGLALNDRRWIATKPVFLFPVQVMSRLFRGKLLAGLKRLYERRELAMYGKLEHLLVPEHFEALIDSLYRTDFVVYAKRPFGGAEHVYAYLGRYTHRIGLSNKKLRAIDDHRVRFRTKQGKTCSLGPIEFVRRFLQHVLPTGFTKIRHYGLLSSFHVNKGLVTARRLLGAATVASRNTSDDDNSWRQRFFELTGIDLRVCPRCRTQTLVRKPLPTPIYPRPPFRPTENACHFDSS